MSFGFALIPCSRAHCRISGTFGCSMKPYRAVIAVEAVLQLLDGDALVGLDLRHLARHDRHENHLLVQHLVVLEVMQQHDRHAVVRRRHEHGGAGNARRLAARDIVEEEIERQRAGVQRLVEQDGVPSSTCSSA